MPEEVLFEFESRTRRGEIADYLRTVADRLDGDGTVTLSGAGESLTLEVPGTPEFEVKAEREGPEGGAKELSIELELEWPEDAEAGDEGDGTLRIE